jgi:hypothetical protein
VQGRKVIIERTFVLDSKPDPSKYYTKDQRHSELDSKYIIRDFPEVNCYFKKI